MATILNLIFSTAITLVAMRAAADHTLISFQFYVHDDYNTTDLTTVHVAGPPFFDPRIVNGSMGGVAVFDDLVTEGPLRSSKSLGRAQGFNMNSALALDTTFWAFTVSFSDGGHKGSTLSIQGLDRYYIPGRELSVVGGTGKLRNANGYTNMYTVSVVNGTSLFLERFVAVVIGEEFQLEWDWRVVVHVEW